MRPARIRGAANACPYCGATPLLCTECGAHLNQPCSKCKKLALHMLREMETADDAQILFDHHTLSKSAIVEGTRWDGSDLMHGSDRTPRDIVTWRVVDLLLRIHARPFVATPLRVCVDGMSADQEQWLKRAITPFQ